MVKLIVAIRIRSFNTKKLKIPISISPGFDSRPTQFLLAFLAICFDDLQSSGSVVGVLGPRVKFLGSTVQFWGLWPILSLDIYAKPSTDSEDDGEHQKNVVSHCDRRLL